MIKEDCLTTYKNDLSIGDKIICYYSLFILFVGYVFTLWTIFDEVTKGLVKINKLINY